MKLDPQRKTKLEQAIGEIQDAYSLDTIYAIGLATIIRDDQYDPRVTGEEVKAILVEHGMTEIDVPILPTQEK